MQYPLKMNRAVVFLCALLIGYGGKSFAQGSLTPKYSNEYMHLGVGARAFAMGGAQTTHGGDATAAYWNPAGMLSMKERYNLGLMHAEYMGGAAKYDYAGLIARIDSVSAVGLSVIRYGVDDIPDTRNLFDGNGSPDYSRIAFFSAADYGFLLSYARMSQQISGLHFGASAKVVHRSVGPFANAWGFGLDLAAQYRLRNWQFGAVLRDATTTFNSWSYNTELLADIYSKTGNEIPERSTELTLPRLLLGVARTFSFTEDLQLLTAMDLVTTFDGKRNTLMKTSFASLEPQLGLELGWKERIYLRAGIGQWQQIQEFDGSSSWASQPTAGLGLKFRSFRLDYAMTDVGNQAAAPYSHIFSINLDLNPKAVSHE